MSNVLAPHHTKAVWGPIMDMAEYQRPYAIWLRQQQENMADERGQSTSAILAVCGAKPSEETRIWKEGDYLRMFGDPDELHLEFHQNNSIVHVLTS